MRTIFLMIMQIAAAMALCGWLFWLAISLANSPRPPAQQSIANDLAVAWTTAPTRVDRQTQNFEVIADPFQFSLRVAARPQMAGSASFIVGEKVYLFDGVTGYQPRELCQEAGGARTACGNRAIAAAVSFLSNRWLQCRTLEIGRFVELIRCKLNGRDLTEELIRRNLARPGVSALALD